MIRLRFLTAPACAIGVLLAGPAYAQLDPSEVREHPVVRHYPGASIDSFEEKEFDALDMVVAYSATPKPKLTRRDVEGRVYKYTYIHVDNASALQVIRNFETALKTAGFSTVIVGKVAALPAMPAAREGSYFGAFQLTSNGAPALYVNILIDPNAGEPVSRVTIVEPEKMAQVYAVDASSLYAGLQAQGRVSVYGINFETNGAVVGADSEAVLSQVREMLGAHPDLKLKIEGHTDNVGAAAANRLLSQQRAAAVKAWLVGQGVGEGRLAVEGFGDSRPVAPNDSDEGRAKNRRVELVRAP